MKSALAMFIVLLVIIPPALSDGFGYSTLTREVLPMKQTSQVAFIDWNEKEYTLDLYVTIGPSEGEFYWIIPFDRIPEEVSVSKYSSSDYQQRIDWYRNRVWKVKNSEYLVDDAFNKQKFVILANPVLVPLMALYPLGQLSGLVGINIGGGWKTTTSKTVKPLKSFSLGEFGTAEVYDSKGMSLDQFFEEKGLPIPKELEKYSNKKIVVFRLNKLDSPTNLLVSFKFKSNGSLFYPSSTTSLWSDYEQEDFVVYILLPRDFSVSNASVRPSGEVTGPEHTYVYYYGSNKVFNNDIRLELEKENKPFRLSTWINLYIPLDWVTTILMACIMWLSPYWILKKMGAWSGLSIEMFLRYCVYALMIGLFIWPFMLILCMV